MIRCGWCGDLKKNDAFNIKIDKSKINTHVACAKCVSSMDDYNMFNKKNNCKRTLNEIMVVFSDIAESAGINIFNSRIRATVTGDIFVNQGEFVVRSRESTLKWISEFSTGADLLADHRGLGDLRMLKLWRHIYTRTEASDSDIIKHMKLVWAQSGIRDGFMDNRLAYLNNLSKNTGGYGMKFLDYCTNNCIDLWNLFLVSITQISKYLTPNVFVELILGSEDTTVLSVNKHLGFDYCENDVGQFFVTPGNNGLFITNSII